MMCWTGCESNWIHFEYFVKKRFVTVMFSNHIENRCCWKSFFFRRKECNQAIKSACNERKLFELSRSIQFLTNKKYKL